MKIMFKLRFMIILSDWDNNTDGCYLVKKYGYNL